MTVCRIRNYVARHLCSPIRHDSTAVHLNAETKVETKKQHMIDNGYRCDSHTGFVFRQLWSVAEAAIYIKEE